MASFSTPELVLSTPELVGHPIGASGAAAARENNPEHIDEALRELAHRSVPGIAFHFALFGFVELRLPGEDHLPRHLVAAVFVCFLVIRSLGVYLVARRRGSVQQRLTMLAIGGIGTAGVWGLRAIALQHQHGTSEPAMVMVVIMCGLSAAAMTAYAPSLWLQRATQSAMFMPLVVLGFAGLCPLSLAILHALYFAYITAQGTVAHRNYWQVVRATASLRRHAEAAQLAAIATDATNRQLRDEIAHRAKVEIELRQAQKLEAIGRLAAGIAHEINTPVQFVCDSCRFVTDGVEQLRGALDDQRRIAREVAAGELGAADALVQIARIDHERDLPYLVANLPDAAARALQGLDRVAKIVAATKEFAYPYVRDKSLADINKAIESTLIISNHETKYVADVATELGELPEIQVHVGELNQAVLGIIVNAAHAIRDAVDGTQARGAIRIKTWADGDRIWIAISDTGTGIPCEILDKIYEPFFTTKPVGAGTGQGLAIARSAIVDKHGGTIDVRSELGVGTTFTISLPIA